MSGDFDVLVVGGGPGGYVCAIRAAQLGLKTGLAEREALGGVCLNWGCIPTKALLKAGEAYEGLKGLKAMGIETGEASFNMETLVARSRKVADRLSRGVEYLMKKNKVEVIKGEAKWGKGAVEVGGEKMKAKSVVWATGARARGAGTLAGDGDRIWTYKEAMIPKGVPESVAVVGAGAIGSEFASFYRALGVEVWLLEGASRILPLEDEEVSALVEKVFKKRGIKTRTNCMVEGVKKGKGWVELEFSGEKVKVERVISATGIEANTEGLGLEEAGVKLEKGHVITDGWGRTGVEGMYAIGDMAGGPWLAHKAMREGVLAAEASAGMGEGEGLDATLVPSCVYSDPQTASVGLTEAAAKEAGHKVKTGRFPFSANGKALAEGKEEGFAKMVFDGGSGELLGAHLVGSGVTELIATYVLGRGMEATEEDFERLIVPHPTLGEAAHEAVLGAWGKALHI